MVFSDSADFVGIEQSTVGEAISAPTEDIAQEEYRYSTLTTTLDVVPSPSSASEPFYTHYPTWCPVRRREREGGGGQGTVRVEAHSRPLLMKINRETFPYLALKLKVANYPTVVNTISHPALC